MSAPLSQRHGEACRFEHMQCMQCMQCRRFECLRSPRWHLCRQPFRQVSCWKLIIFHHGWNYIPLILWACIGNSTLWIKETSTPQGPLIAHTHGHTVITSSREAIDSVGMCWLQAYLVNSMCLPSWHIFFLTQWWCEGEGWLSIFVFFGQVCFSAFPAFVLFLLLCPSCFSAFPLFAFPAFLLFCFSACLFLCRSLFCFSVFSAFAFPDFLLFCLCAFLLLLFLSSVTSVMCFCCSTSCSSASLLPFFTVSLFFIFFCFILSCLYPKWRTKDPRWNPRTPRNPDKKSW